MKESTTLIADMAISIDRNSIVPIYQQLEQQLRLYIVGETTAVRLPSERELAERLDISRQSIKQAFELLQKQDLIRRNGNKGTFSNPGAAEQSAVAARVVDHAAFDLSGVHPMSVREFLPANAPTRLELALFENYPFQKRFWEHAVELFNRTRSAIHVEIRWLPRQLDLSDQTAYCRATIGCDIHQNCNFPELLQPLSGALQQQQLRGAHCWSWCQGISDERLFPVYTYFWSLFGNRKIWESYIGGDWRHVGEGDLLDEFPAWRAKLPEDIYLAEQPLPFINGRGFSAAYGVAELSEYCGKLENLARLPQVFYGYRADLNGKFAAFFEGRELLFPGCSNYMLYGFPRLEETVFQTLLWPRRGYYSLTAASCLGIAADCPAPEAATEFLAFLLSDALQEDIFRQMNVIPASRHVLDIFQQSFPWYDHESCRNFIEQLQLASPGGLLDRLGARVYDFKALTEGRIDAEELRKRLRNF